MDSRAAEAIVKGLRAMSKDFYSQLQLRRLMAPWSNIRGQLSLIYNALLLPSEVVNFSLFPGKKVIYQEDYSSLSATARSIAGTLAMQTWNSLELFELTASVIDSENFEDAKPIFELASRQCPELLCVALAAINPNWNSINKEILVKLTCGFLLGQPSSSVVLPKVWGLNPNVLLFCMVEMHRRDSSVLSRLLDVAQELKVLPIILDAKPFSFTIDLACLASRRQHLNLEKWVLECCKEKGEVFLRAAVDYFSDRIFSHAQAAGGASAQQPAARESLLALSQALSKVAGFMPHEVLERFRELQRSTGEEAPEPAFDSSLAHVQATHTEPSSFALDVEEEVNNFFDRIFARGIAIPDVIEVLRKLRASGSLRDQQIFSCFLHNIFDEYRFFSKYPENELILTAVLFGQLINSGVLPQNALSTALRCVVDALKKTTNQKLFKFGLQSLMQFHLRLAEWPQLCSQLLQIPHLLRLYPDLHAFITSCAAVSDQAAVSPVRGPTGPGRSPQAASADATAGGAGAPLTGFARGGYLKTGGDALAGESASILLEREAEGSSPAVPPSAQVRDRILFIINNLSPNNLEAKANDLVKILEEGHFPWLSQYLVINRASQEPNYHSLYLGFLDVLQLPPLSLRVLKQTYSSIYLLLESPKILNSSSERTLLKNLGSWLGGLTVARDQPILYRDLSLKDLLIDAFFRDRLIVIIPFVCKVTEQCRHSQAFLPENPWLMAIMRLLAELYSYTDLKLNLKFEIEVLCKNLQIDIQSLEPSNLLKQEKTRSAGGLSFKPSPVMGGVGGGEHLGAGHATITGGILKPESALFPLIILNGKAASNGVLRKITAFAVELAIREIFSSVFDRSFQQAVSTARVVVENDFSGENDDDAYRGASSNLAASLCSSTAAVVARDSVRAAITYNIRLYSQWAGISQGLPESVIDTIAENNCDLGNAYLEKLCLERAHSKARVLFAAEAKARKKLANAPRMTPEQIRVYEDVARRANAPHLVALPSIALEAPSQGELESLALSLSASVEPRVAGTGGGHFVDSSPLPSSLQPLAAGPEAVGETALMSPGLPVVDSNLDAFFESVCLKFVELVGSIEDSICRTDPSITLVSGLPPTHEIRSLMKQIVMLASSSPIHRDELCLLMAQRLMQGLYRTESPLYVDVIILLLIKIFEFSSKAAKEVTTWVVHSTDERKYSVLATAALFGSGLIYVLDFDGQLSKQIASGRKAAIEFAIKLIRRCVFGDSAVAAPYDFVYSLDALGKIAQEEPGREDISSLLQDVASMVKAPQPETQVLRDQITFCFTDWFRLCQYPSISEKLISSFIAQLFQRRFLSDESSARPFFQICTEICIELYVRQRRAPAILAYRSIDAFSRLVSQIIRHHPGKEGGNAVVGIERLRIVTIVHSVAGMILVQGLEQGLDYLQRPFSRLFVSLASDLTTVMDSFALVENLSSFYMMISPRIIPAFCFGWFEVITNRKFLPYLLEDGERRGWKILAELLEEFLHCIQPFMENYEAQESTRALYRGVLRVMLSILHDCPEFLATHGPKLAEVIPLEGVQLRNTLLAASATASAGAELPDPLTFTMATFFRPTQDIAHRVEALAANLEEQLKLVADELFASRRAGAIRQLTSMIATRGPQVLNHSLLSYLGSLTLSHLPSAGVDLRTHIGETPIADLALALCGGETNRTAVYYFLSAMADQLGQPGPMTSLYYCLFLWAFGAVADVSVKEIITRVLLERLIVHRPHPWGVMVTFIELVKNPSHRFWEYPFTRVTPDIERVFQAISRSCLQGAAS